MLITLRGAIVGESPHELLGYMHLRNVLLANGFTTDEVISIMWLTPLYDERPDTDERYLAAWPRAREIDYKDIALKLLPSAVEVAKEKW